MDRFKIVFNNSGTVPPRFNNLGSGLATRPSVSVPQKQNSLNSPMIERVYKAKPGCSACGKKVA